MNPIEQEGTYPLPEAQVDRFMLKVVLDYPTPAEEAENHPAEHVAGVPEGEPRADAGRHHPSPPCGEGCVHGRKIEKYIVDITFATRRPGGL